MLRWNTNKGYLLELGRAGCPVVPRNGSPLAHCPIGRRRSTATGWSSQTSDWATSPPGRYDATQSDQRSSLSDHVHGLVAAGCTAVVQPYQSQIDAEGEISLIYIADTFSHAVCTAPVLSGETSDGHRRCIDDGSHVRVKPTPAQHLLAECVLDLVPGSREDLLYARVDMVYEKSRGPLLMGLALTEPKLVLSRCSASGAQDGVGHSRMARGAARRRSERHEHEVIGATRDLRDVRVTGNAGATVLCMRGRPDQQGS